MELATLGRTLLLVLPSALIIPIPRAMRRYVDWFRQRDLSRRA